MVNRRISISDIVIGQPLLWEVYGSDNRLLQRRGDLINKPNQVAALIDRDLFANFEGTVHVIESQWRHQ